jgi:RHS repeat-associated protein
VPWAEGQRIDGESGLYHMKNCYYDPEIGRFITRDPGRNKGGRSPLDGPNLCAFVNNNPIAFVDAVVQCIL